MNWGHFEFTITFSLLNIVNLNTHAFHKSEFIIFLLLCFEDVCSLVYVELSLHLVTVWRMFRKILKRLIRFRLLTSQLVHGFADESCSKTKQLVRNPRLDKRALLIGLRIRRSYDVTTNSYWFSTQTELISSF